MVVVGGANHSRIPPVSLPPAAPPEFAASVEASPERRRGRPAYDAVIVGAGPNGLAAAATLARAGCSVLVLEAANSVGGGARSAELTLPGIIHDVCSAVHPLAAYSPFFRSMPLAQHGLTWIEPPAALAHPFDDGTAALLLRSVSATAETLGCGRRHIGG